MGNEIWQQYRIDVIMRKTEFSPKSFPGQTLILPHLVMLYCLSHIQNWLTFAQNQIHRTQDQQVHQVLRNALVQIQMLDSWTLCP